MEEDVTVVDESNCDTILAAAPKILELFGVRVQRFSRLDVGDGGVFIKTSVAPGPASSLRSSDGPSPPDEQHSSDAVLGVIIYPAADDGVGLDSVNSAKVYMRCLTCDDSLRHVHTTQYDTDVYAALQHNNGTIERQTQAVVACDNNTRTVTISGLRENVAMATALTNRMLSNIAQSHYMTLGPSTSTDGSICHDKDGTTCLSAVPRHQGLCRTVSGNNNSIPKSQSDSAMCKKKALCRTRTLQEDLSAAAYADKVEFALKLGYTEDQLRCVLEKLGWHVRKNELLSELVQLGSLEKSDNESDELGDLNRSGQRDSEVDFSGCNLDHTANSDDCSERGESSNLRPIVIDGSNVAMSHGSKKVFSCYGIKLTVDWFHKRGHTEITVFVPQWRKETSRPDTLITDQEILLELEKEKVLVFTPARRVCGKRIVCYDDRYIIKLAADNGGVVVSNDNYRDLINEATEYKKVIEERLLMYSFVNDRFMPPEDPLGRRGPSLDNFLRMAPLIPEPLPPTCPYGKKCTYGNKCRYYHPERGLQPHRSVVEKLAERADKNRLVARGHTTASPTNSLTGGSGQKPVSAKTPVKRALTKSRSLVTGGCVSKTPLGARNSMCCNSISRDVCSDMLCTQVTKKVTSPDDLDTSQMTVSVMVSQGDVADSCHGTEKLTMATQELSACGGPAVREDCVWASEPWTRSSHVLLPTRTEPTHLHLGGGHLSLARKLSDESRLTLQKELSLKGAEDLQLLSKDDTKNQHPKADWFNEANDAEKWFVSNSARSSPQLEGQVATGIASTAETGGASFRRRKSCGRAHQFDLLHQFRTDHSPLNRNVSAPVTTATTLPFPRSIGATMQRQSSTSDPLLHAKDDGAYVVMPTEVPPGGCVMTTPPVSWSFSTEKKFQHRSPVYRAAPPSVTSLGPNRQIKVAFTPMVQQPFPAGQQLVETQPPVVHMGSGAMMDAFVSRSPNHMIPMDISRMSRQQAEVMRSYGNVPSHVHVAEPVAMNATAQHLIPNLSQPPPSYQVAPPVTAVSEKRRNLYFHLCGLFPEEKVSHVMQQYPTEVNPQILCTHLIRMSYV